MSKEPENQEVQPVEPTPEHGYWKSLRELDGTTEWQQNGLTKQEFAPGADQPPAPDPMSPRNFIHLMNS